VQHGLNVNGLYALVKAGNAKAEEMLFSALRARFCLITRPRIRQHDDVEEIVQEALSIVAEKYRDMEFDVGFSNWALTVLKNCIVSFLRKKATAGRRHVGFSDEYGVHPKREIDPEVKRQLLRCLRQVIRKNRQYARALALRYQGYDADEICQRLQLRRSTYYSALSRARTMLSSCLEKGNIG
jgi:RNA polymerase sigma factor (sigma-70 family)